MFSVQSLPDVERLLCCVISCEKGEEGAAPLETCPSAGLFTLLIHPSAAKIYHQSILCMCIFKIRTLIRKHSPPPFPQLSK